MKLKLILLLLLTSGAFYTKAQFAPVGAIWDYVELDIMHWPEERGIRIKIEKDTLIQGKIYSQFENGSLKTLDSGRVYFFAQNAPHLLFDFNAQQGDTLEIECRPEYPDTIYTVPIRIDTVYYVKDNDLDSVRAYEIHSLTPDIWSEPNPIVYEKFIFGHNFGGYTAESNDLFPITREAYNIYFYCYRDPNGNYFNFVDSIYCGLLSTQEVEQLNQDISVYPNPANQILHIQNPTNRAISGIELYSNNGKLVNDISITQQHELEISSLNAGTYWLILTLDNNVRIAKKIVIER